MSHRDFEGWNEYNRRLAAATETGHPEWVRLASTLKEAGGLRPYFTGRKCKYGHISPRYKMGKCMMCGLNGL